MQLLDVVEEVEHALREQCRGVFVVVGEAVVGEKVSIARVQEQLGALDRLVELAATSRSSFGGKTHWSASIMWIWSGTPCGHAQPNSEVGTQL